MNRVRAFQEELSRRGFDAAVMTSIESLQYFTGLHVYTFYSPNSLAVIPARGEPVLVVVRADESLARATSRVRVETYAPSPQGFRATAAKCRNVLAQAGVSKGRVGLEFGWLSVERYRVLEETLAGCVLDDITGPLAEIRLIKDADEQAAFRGATELAKVAFSQGIQRLCPGASELEVKSALDCAVYLEGARRWPDAILYAQTNVLTGPKADRLHDISSGRVMRAGEVAFVNMGVTWNGYWANLARTLVVPGGEPPAGGREAIVAAEHAQRATVESLGPGRTLGHAARAAEGALAVRGLAERRTYPLFRGLGLRTDERPRALELDFALRPGVCLAAQIYLHMDGFIVGQTDSVLITEERAELLTGTEIRE